MEAKALVKKCLLKEKLIAILREQRDQGEETLRQETYKLKCNVFEPKIRALEKERDEKINALAEEWKKIGTKIESKITESLTVVSQVQRVLAFLRLKRKDLTIKDEDIEAYGEKHIESLGLVFDNEFLKVKLFIVENSKPKNRYSLVAFGKSIFTNRGEGRLIDLPYGYGVPTYEHDSYSLRTVITDMPTIEEVKEYWAKHQFWLKSIEANYKKTKVEYLSILEDYQIEDFVDFLAYTCDCGAFYTKWEKGSIGGECACPDCGKPMTKRTTAISS